MNHDVLISEIFHKPDELNPKRLIGRFSKLMFCVIGIVRISDKGNHQSQNI